MRIILSIAMAALIMTSCVSSKKYKELEALSDKNLEDKLDCQDKLATTGAELKDCETEVDKLKNTISLLEADKAKLALSKEQLEKELASYKKLNDELQASKKSILSEANANQAKLNEALAKKEKELDAIAAAQKALDAQLKAREDELNAMLKKNEEQSKRISELEAILSAKDKALSDLKANIQNALKGFSSEEIQVIEKNGKLYVSLSEKLLFKSGSFTVDPKGEEAITKLGEILNSQTDFDIVVEGHTDNVAYKGTGQLLDNWDLSVKRATSVVRILTEKGKLAPEKVSASGRGEYLPVLSNDSAENKAKNRRTEIILSPKLDKILNLLNQ